MSQSALQGIRILDFSAFLAGPEAGLLLAYLGAEVIKVESRDRLDPMRTRSAGGARTYESSPLFSERNVNKLGVSINLRRPEGVSLARQLAVISDGAIENFRPGVMAKLGLDYAALKVANPRLVMVSISGFGQEGPERENVAMASVFGAASGLGNITGYPDSPPVELRMPMDACAGVAGAFAMVAGLMNRDHAGEGMYIDLAATALVSSFTGELLLDHLANGRTHSRQGNRDDAMAPHNCYPCRGADRWISIAVASDAEWQALCAALDREDWAADPRFSDAHRRWRHQEELDRLIGGETRNYSNHDLTTKLQARGVAAYPSMSGEDFSHDPHLAARDVFTTVEHPFVGRQVVLSPPWQFSRTPARISHRAPLLGEHNEYIFGELLGLSRGKIDSLIEDQIIY